MLFYINYFCNKYKIKLNCFHISYKLFSLPVTNAFRSWPLNPVVQGLTVTTLLLLKQMKTKNDTKTRNENPPTVDHITTEWCFWFEFCEFIWFEDGAGEGAEIQLECGGVDKTVGEGDTTGEGEGEDDGEGESSGDVNRNGRKNDGDGDGEFERLSDGETSEDVGDDDEGEGEGFSLWSKLLVLCEIAEFDVCRSFLLYGISPCWPKCLSQACKIVNII